MCLTSVPIPPIFVPYSPKFPCCTFPSTLLTKLVRRMEGERQRRIQASKRKQILKHLILIPIPVPRPTEHAMSLHRRWPSAALLLGRLEPLSVDGRAPSVWRPLSGRLLLVEHSCPAATPIHQMSDRLRAEE